MGMNTTFKCMTPLFDDILKSDQSGQLSGNRSNNLKSHTFINKIVNWPIFVSVLTVSMVSLANDFTIKQLLSPPFWAPGRSHENGVRPAEPLENLQRTPQLFNWSTDTSNTFFQSSMLVWHTLLNMSRKSGGLQEMEKLLLPWRLIRALTENTNCKLINMLSPFHL